MIGERLKQIRKEKRLSQKELANLIDSSQGYICDIEQGKKMPGSDFLCALKRVFPLIDMNWLLSDDETWIVAEKVESYLPAVDRETGIITKMLGEMTEEQKEDVRKYCEMSKYYEKVKKVG